MLCYLFDIYIISVAAELVATVLGTEYEYATPAPDTEYEYVTPAPSAE